LLSSVPSGEMPNATTRQIMQMTDTEDSCLPGLMLGVTSRAEAADMDNVLPASVPTGAGAAPEVNVHSCAQTPMSTMPCPYMATNMVTTMSTTLAAALTSSAPAASMDSRLAASKMTRAKGDWQVVPPEVMMPCSPNIARPPNSFFETDGLPSSFDYGNFLDGQNGVETSQIFPEASKPPMYNVPLQPTVRGCPQPQVPALWPMSNSEEAWQSSLPQQRLGGRFPNQHPQGTAGWTRAGFGKGDQPTFFNRGDRDSDMQGATISRDEPLVTTDNMMSLGCVGHPHSCAPACKFFRTLRGCKDGDQCTRCHMCRWQRGKKKGEEQEAGTTNTAPTLIASRPGQMQSSTLQMDGNSHIGLDAYQRFQMQEQPGGNQQGSSSRPLLQQSTLLQMDSRPYVGLEGIQNFEMQHPDIGNVRQNAQSSNLDIPFSGQAFGQESGQGALADRACTRNTFLHFDDAGSSTFASAILELHTKQTSISEPDHPRQPLYRSHSWTDDTLTTTGFRF